VEGNDVNICTRGIFYALRFQLASMSRRA